VEGFEEGLDRYARSMINDALSCAIVGSPETVRQGMEAFIARTGASELMVTANIFDHEKRKRSFSIAAGARGGLKAAA
jgi:alkanesulfonate monooxygenase SsuD/methylene tetrahydromethanopterin reductase-like flavin-dependent oxidoreductase (luciferase family)